MRKTNFRKATLSALLMLVVAVVSLTGVTYAWFTSGTTASVNDIEMTVDGEEGGLLIAKNDWDFKSSISFDGVGEGVKYNPVSTTVDGLKTGTFFTAQVGDESSSNIKQISKLSTSSTDIFKQDIYFNNFGGAAKTIELSGSLEVTGKDRSAALATRVAIVVQGSTKTPDYTKLDQEVSGTQQVLIYEPNADLHTSAGRNEAKLDVNNKDKAENAKYTYAGIFASQEGEYSKYLDTTNSAVLQTVETLDLPSAFSVANPDAAITLAEDSLVKATIYIWIEGQDHDCHNDIAGDTISARFTFTIVE